MNTVVYLKVFKLLNLKEPIGSYLAASARSYNAQHHPDQKWYYCNNVGTCSYTPKVATDLGFGEHY